MSCSPVAARRDGLSPRRQKVKPPGNGCVPLSSTAVGPQYAKGTVEMKASELVTVAATLLKTYGVGPVMIELTAITTGRSKPQIQSDVEAAVEAAGGVDELTAILDALPAPAAPAQPRPRATKAEVDALEALVLERAKALGSAFSSTELASQLGKPVGSVSHALHKLVARGVLKLDGTRKNARYS